jgi:hypothetical protein
VTLKEILKIAEEEWKLIDARDIRNLFESMPRRMAEVIKNKGGAIDY